MTPTLLSFVVAMSAFSPAHADERTNKQELKETDSAPGYWPTRGLVPDAKTAIAIAIAVWEPIYGKMHIAEEAPYQAVLSNNLWTVRGSVPGGGPGGTALAVIARKDGRIIKVSHSK